MSRILVIDDDPICLQATSAILERAGHEVDRAQSAQAGLDSYRETHPDLVVCDVFMPEKDGLTVLRELKEEDPDARVLLMSGHWNLIHVDAKHLGNHLGAIDVLKKPLAAKELRTVVEAALSPSSSS